jgi:hypothetical protein
MAADEAPGRGERDESRDTGRDDGFGGGWDETVLDADFIRSAPTAEPSARARMLAARWRAGAPDPEPWRADEAPAGWFFSKARRRRWRRR